MLRPVGDLPSAVYWRRRLVMLAVAAVLLVLVVLTFKALTGGDETQAAAANSPAPSTTSTHHAGGSTTTQPAHSHSSSHAPANGTSASSSSSGQAAPQPCAASQLKISAVVGATSYSVGDEPVVMLQVTNTGTALCVQDLGGSNVELRVYNGESRVWGSNDCSDDTAAMPRTLAVNAPVRVRVVWSGLTSQKSCAGTRQRVGAGTYTLYPLLDGKTGTAAQFSLT